MKLLAALLLIGATSAPAFAGGPVIRGQRNVHYEEKCYKNVEDIFLVIMMTSGTGKLVE